MELIPDKSRTYTLQLQIMDVLAWLGTYPDKTVVTGKDIKEILGVASVKVWSTSPSFHWQGMNYFLSKLDASIHPTTIEPQFWNSPHLHGDVYFLDKHLSGLLRSINFWMNPMAQMLTKILRQAGYLS